jgi:hypothetical protein
MEKQPANISVVVPTYRRPQALRWALVSVLAQQLDEPVGRCRIVILNNDTERKGVEDVVRNLQSIQQSTPWEVQIVHRDPPMVPGLNWYEGVREFTENGDLVFLHSDDDLMWTDSVRTRVRQMSSKEGACDFLLARNYSGLIYDVTKDNEKVFLPARPLAAPDDKASESHALTTELLQGRNPGFMSLHSYRNTPGLWTAYELTRQRLSKAPAELKHQTGMLPWFMALAMADAGIARCSDFHCCIAGHSYADISTGGRMLWSGAFLEAVPLYVLEHTDLAGRADLQWARDFFYRRLAIHPFRTDDPAWGALRPWLKERMGKVPFAPIRRAFRNAKSIAKVCLRISPRRAKQRLEQSRELDIPGLMETLTNRSKPDVSKKSPQT